MKNKKSILNNFNIINKIIILIKTKFIKINIKDVLNLDLSLTKVYLFDFFLYKTFEKQIYHLF